MGYLMKKVDWFEKITERLRVYSEGEVWTSGDEILCKSESAANAIADILTTLYKTQGDEIFVNIGFYDPEEDERNGEVDKYTGWWYVNIQ